MLRLARITKNYKVAGGEIKVLKGLDIAFRKNEFVSILGPSGCGKTTTLNIVGGLDKYTSGDLFIAGKSTKDFTDRDWDFYRNQRIGFIFQSYNLIPHQTVLANVELALTISGVSSKERTERAMLALEKVGLKGEEHKRPNQLSGGQSQRVAIARALVNEPDILLADEPTGALDSKTSLQIMELIKEIAKDRLVIMVTHNGELAKEYSTRIIELVDGEVVSDSNPFSIEDEVEETKRLTLKEKNKKSKAKMSFWTAFKLSFKNLLTKRARTILTSVAGSIGIIGISAVLAVSTGVRAYIDNMQDDMLSGNPIVVAEEDYNLSAMMGNMKFTDKVEFLKEKGYVSVDSTIEFLAKQYKTMDSFTIENTLTQDYVDYALGIPLEHATVSLNYKLDLTNNFYTDFNVDQNQKSNISVSAIQNRYTNIMKQTEFKEQASLISSLGDVLKQAPSDVDYILSQYDLLDGKVGTEKNQLTLVVNKNSVLTDLMLARLGYYTQEEFVNIIHRVDEVEGNYDQNLDKMKFTYSELVGKTFTYYTNDSIFIENQNTFTKEINPYFYNYDSAMINDDSGKVEFEIVGILCPKDTINFGCLEAGLYYTDALTEYAIEQSKQSNIVTKLSQREPDKQSFPGTMINNIPYGIVYNYDYTYEGQTYTATAFVGKMNTMAGFMASMTGATTSELYELTLRHLGGEDIPSVINIYPKDFEKKDLVTDYLDKWNEDGDIVIGDKVLTRAERNNIDYSDNISTIIDMIDTMINVITIALISFTSLALVVSCVMISIITYVSVVERVKEIGVIRALGGRKRDVSNLFNAETTLLGLGSGLFGVGITYFISFVVNLIVNNLAGFSIMLLPISSALIMVALSVTLTVLSGLVPAKKASRQDPVVALRTE